MTFPAVPGGPSVEVPVKFLFVPTSDMMHLQGSSPSSLSIINTFTSLSGVYLISIQASC